MPNEETSDIKPKKSSKKITKIVVVLILLCLVGAGFYLLQTEFNVLNFVKAKNQSLKSQVETLTTELKQDQTSIKNIQSYLKDRSAFKQKQNDSLFITQIDYLVKTASFAINVNQNIPLALKNLKMAAKLAGKIKDPKNSDKLLSALNSDIQNVKETKFPDLSKILQNVEKISYRLEKIKSSPNISSLMSFKAKNKEAVKTASTQKANSSAATTNETGFKAIWHEIVAKLTAIFKNAVVLRHSEQKIQPLLTKEQANVAITQMQIRLLLAETALFNHQFDLFHQEIIAVKESLKTNFSQYPNRAFAPIYTELNNLKNINFSYPLPTLMLSTKAVNDVIEALP